MKKNFAKNDVTKNESKENPIEEFYHHSKLFWQVTSIFTTALGGLLIFLESNESVLLNIFGFIVTGVLIHFAASFRVLKQEALAKAINMGQIEKNKIHLDQWKLYLVIWFIIGFLFWYNIFKIIWHSGFLNRFSYVLMGIWIGVVVYYGVKYNQTFTLQEALNKNNGRKV